MRGNEIMNQKKVSVIIPTYKRSVEYVSRAVESVINQSYSNLEIIVVDDSPENYENRNDISRYMNAISNDKVRYVQNEKNMGGSLSRNRGIEIATGYYVTFLDDDDEYKVDKVKNQVEYMEETDCDLSFSDMVMYNVDGQVVDYRSHKEIASFDNEYLLKYHLMKHMTGTPTFMFKRDKLKEIGGFDDAKMGQEFFLMLKAIENGLKIGYFQQCDVKVYKHEDGGISQGKNKINGELFMYEFKKKYFDILTKKEIQYINFRHWTVMAIAYKRNKMYLAMAKAGLKGFLSSPKIFFDELCAFVNKIRKVEK